MDDFDIPIFKKTYELYKIFYGYRNAVSKQNRYTIWQRCENLILDVLEGILFASQSPKSEKLPILEKASLKLNFLRVFLRLTKEIKAIDNKKYLVLQELIDEIGRMLGGWIRSMKERQRECPSDWWAFFYAEERLREERRSRGIVGIRIAHPVGVEPHLAALEVEVRRVRELAIGVRIIASAHPWHWKLRFTSRQSGTISSQSCILFGSSPAMCRTSALGKSKQYLLNTTRSGKP